MAIRDSVIADVTAAIDSTWNIRDGIVVPETDDVLLAGGGVRLHATFLYADLADSTELAMWNRQVTAKICKAFLATASRLIRHYDGDVRSFDGDRVMGVFLGNNKNSSAARCALAINWAFVHVLKPRFLATFTSLTQEEKTLSFCSGIDVSEVLAVRSGIRNANDLIWIGRAPNVAAKLCSLRDGEYHTWITGDVFDQLRDDLKIGNNGSSQVWQERSWTAGPVVRVYRSNFYGAP